jgi:coenzyme PQQ precursor peptide PqqA
VTSANKKRKEELMAWKTPKIIVILLGAEINSYACAEMK